MKFSVIIVSALVALVTALPNPEISREYHELEARKGGGGAGDILELGIDLAIQGIQSLINGIKQDKIDRGEFTKNLVGELNKKDPKYNYVVCHTKHTTKFDGVKGKDWFHSHREFDIKIGGTIGYEIYMAKSGEFKNNGDGGYLNWAFIGNVKTRDQNGSRLVFGPR